MLYLTDFSEEHPTWNKGKLMGQKPHLKLKEVWAIRTRLQMAHKTRELAMFNLTIDSKLRSCDLLRLQVRDVAHGTQILKRAMILQQMTQQSVQFELTAQTREALSTWIQQAKLNSGGFLFQSRRIASAKGGYWWKMDQWPHEDGADGARLRNAPGGKGERRLQESHGLQTYGFLLFNCISYALGRAAPGQ